VSGRLLEICCDSVESAKAASDGGADRIELCVDLPADGLTPPLALLREVKAIVPIPVFVLVRCRAGDFVFNAEEIAAMCAEIEARIAGGADGVVCGALLQDGTIDQEATRRFIGATGGLPFTFHKAFDAAANFEEAMGSLVKLGVDRVLTSAGEKRAIDAIDRLARLAKVGAEQTRILCGGGVRSENLTELAKIPGVTEFHSAARAAVAQPVNSEEVRAMRAVLERVS